MLNKNKKQYTLQTRHNVSSSVIRLHFECIISDIKDHMVTLSVGRLAYWLQQTN